MQRVKLSPLVRSLLSFGLIGLGALTVISSVVNIVATWNFIDAAEEQSLGISRGEFVLTYAALLPVGVAMIYFGLRWRR